MQSFESANDRPAAPAVDADSALNPFTAAETPRRRWWQLRFTNELESEFQAVQHQASRRWVRVSLVVALSTVLGFAVIDHWVLRGPASPDSNWIRFGVHLPMVLVMMFISKQRFYDRWYKPAVHVAAPIFGVGIVILAMHATPEQMPLIASRMVLATFFFYFMLGLSFFAALRTNAVVIGSYAVLAVVGAVSPQVATYQLFILFCANLIGACGCYALEYANRVAFLDRKRLTQVAMHDGLTGLLNRAALESQVRQLWQQAARERMPVSVVLVDIDHFKAFNDRYGHQAGDQCLRDVASAIRRVARRRPLDLVARYGGEELIAVLFGADRTHAETVAREVRESVMELHIPHTASPTRPHVTVSVGAATLSPGPTYSYDLAVQLADRALYDVKGRGRDSWAFYDTLHMRSEGALSASGRLSNDEEVQLAG